VAFADHFSEKSAGYASSRPTYPDELFRALAEKSPGRETVWDCATGNGQAAIGLARHFRHVEATDASAEQVANAKPCAGVAYSVQPAERTHFPDASFDAVNVAQALHWFDFERFNVEVARVLRPGGVILATSYGWSHVSPEFDRELKRIVLDPIHPLWPPQNSHIFNGYRDIPFPYERIDFPPVRIELRWTLAQLLAYIGTWTATRRKLQDDPAFLDRAVAHLARAWGSEDERLVTMPLHVQCGRR
jgi:ubiquinone/menaquinone biosynthesis C-methylase UbiE